MTTNGPSPPPIKLKILGTRDTVARFVVALRQIVDVTATTPAHTADPPYEVVRFVDASGLRMTGLASVVAEINATATSYARGNVEAGEAMERIREHLERYRPPARRNARRDAAS